LLKMLEREAESASLLPEQAETWAAKTAKALSGETLTAIVGLAAPPADPAFSAEEAWNAPPVR
jgi:hypothetical protein